MKKYTYKREMFLYNKAHTKRVIIISIIVIIIALILPLSILIKGGILLVIGLPLLIVLMKAKKDCDQWGDDRKKMMQKGVKYVGKVITSGGHEYWGEQWDGLYSDIGAKETYRAKISDWWIEVEYYDTRVGETKRFTAKDMNANGNYLIGRQADVYLYNNQVYIDIT